MPFWKDKQVFVTGASGFIGFWLCKRLVELESHVTILLPDPHEQSELLRTDLVKSVRIVEGNLERSLHLEKVFKSCKIDTVFHLGAETQVKKALENPLATFETNIRGTYLLLEACRLAGLKRLILASSDKSYGIHKNLPYVEETPLQAIYPYDVSKACGDRLAMSYYHTYHLPIAITRCGNVYGGADFNWDRLVPGVLRNLYQDSRPLLRSNGLYLRDYIYVEDVVDGYLKIGELLEEKSLQGEAFNLSTGSPITVLDMVSKLQKLTHKEHLPPILENKAIAEIPHQYLDSRKALHILGWQPTTTLEEGLLKTVTWYSSYLEVTSCALS
ncbi:MAG: NAD-dependent epimerase/dehydratase family protein [Chlamydiae bacterium]|nr:NAD-dependent epimerase/dehydratase family protein [Chlamydiota bacterium]